jgi:cell wall-associated NlpC family hydrolase
VSTRSAVITESLAWVGTPYHHHARVRGAGVDCAQLAAAVYEAAGLIEHVRPTYTHDWHLHQSGEQFIDWILACGGREVAREETLPADLLVWRWGRTFSHSGILLPGDRVVHAWLGLGVTIDSIVSHQELSTRPMRCFTLEGLDGGW